MAWWFSISITKTFLMIRWLNWGQDFLINVELFSLKSLQKWKEMTFDTNTKPFDSLYKILSSVFQSVVPSVLVLHLHFSSRKRMGKLTISYWRLLVLAFCVLITVVSLLETKRENISIRYNHQKLLLGGTLFLQCVAETTFNGRIKLDWIFNRQDVRISILYSKYMYLLYLYYIHV